MKCEITKKYIEVWFFFYEDNEGTKLFFDLALTIKALSFKITTFVFYNN